jgi:hypothetical protein
MSNEIPPLPQPHRDIFTPIYHALTLVLLSGIALILAFGLFRKASLTPECQAAITKANVIITGQSDIIQGLQSSYEKDVYNNSKVETIQQQTFLANEYEFTALQMIAIQNAALLDITTTCH